MRRLVAFIDSRPAAIRVLISAATKAIPFYFAAFLSYWISDVGTTNMQVSKVAVHFAVVLPLLLVFFVVGILVEHTREQMKEEAGRLGRAKEHAQVLVDRVESSRLILLGKLRQIESVAALACGEELQQIVAAAYGTFEAAFGQEQNGHRIDFEVTFMTKSFIDGLITIPASANREGREPRSMVLRADNPHIYDNTVTAEIYKQDRPAPRIVEDTAAEGTHYYELYNEQKQRIRSSIVYPVLSEKTVMLGALVVHCDRGGFFRRAKAKYWYDLLEIFARRLAVVERKLAFLNNVADAGKATLVGWEKPY